MATAWLAVRSRKTSLTALKLYLCFAVGSELFRFPLYLFCNGWYGPAWYVRNAAECVSTFLLTVVLAELFGEGRRAILPGILLACGALTPYWEVLGVTQTVLCFVAGLMAFVPDWRAHIGQGILVLLIFPLVGAYTGMPHWMAHVPTVSALGMLGLWWYGLTQMKERH